MSGAVPLSAARPLERAARVPRPVCPGCGRCGRVDPAPAPQRAPLRAGVARCGGGGRASPGGVLSTIVRGAWCQALSLPRPPVLWSGQPGFRVPCVPGAVGAGVGTQHWPHSVRPCGPALLAVGVAEGRSRGVLSTVVRGAWCQALSLPRPPVLWSGQPGFRDPCVPGAVDGGVWTQHRPHRVRPCGLALLAVGVAEGRPRGGVLSSVAKGAWCQALSLPRPPVLWSGQPGFRVPCVPGCGRCGYGDPAPAPQRAPLWAGVARCGGGGRASPGGVPSNVVRGAWCQPLSLPRPPVLWSGQPGFRVPCVPGAVGAGVGTQHWPHSVRPCGPALLAVGVAEGRPRGVLSTIVRGAWCQALSLPRPPVLWSGQPGFRVPCVQGAVDGGVWTQHQPHSVRPCGLALLAVGVAEGRPRGGCFPLLRGAPGVRRCPSPGRPSSGAGSQGSASRVSRVRLVRVWGPSTGPTACALVGRRCSLWGWRKGVPGGVPSTVVRGAWCQALSLPRPPVLWSGQPGFRDPCVPGSVDAGVWTQHRPHSVRPCGPALLAVGVVEGRPRGGCPLPL